MNRSENIRRVVVVAALVAVGVLNVLPGVALVAPGRLTDLYGLVGLDANLLVLLRHRAWLLALVGIFMLVAVVVRTWQLPALVAGLASNAVYLLLAFTAPVSAEIQRIGWIDLLGLPLLVAGLACAWPRRT